MVIVTAFLITGKDPQERVLLPAFLPRVGTTLSQRCPASGHCRFYLLSGERSRTCSRWFQSQQVGTTYVAPFRADQSGSQLMEWGEQECHHPTVGTPGLWTPPKAMALEATVSLPQEQWDTAQEVTRKLS